MSRASQESGPETSRQSLLSRLVHARVDSVGITKEQAKARCFDACHKAQEARDCVFSDPRR
jgi:hypothetical protein